MSVLSSCYRFVEAASGNLEEQRPLWSSVKDELYALYHLAPLMKTCLSTPWWEEVFATDACEEGFGVVKTKAELQDIRIEYARSWGKEAFV